MNDLSQKRGITLAVASIACIAFVLFVLGHYGVFSTTEDLNIVVQPALIRWVVAVVLGLLIPQFLAAAAQVLGVGGLCLRLAAFLRNVETMPQKVDDIHAAIVKPATKENT
jgi:hypothetical protein